MRYLFRYGAVALVAILSVLLMDAPVSAAETSNSESVIIPTDDVLEDDLYAGAIRVIVDGTLDGDLIAFAGEEVVINGVVTGSVFAMTPSVVVNGRVDGSLRASGGEVVVSGEVGRDVVVAGFALSLTSESNVTGDVVAWVWSGEALGSIGGDLGGSFNSLDVAGQVDGDIEVSVSQLRVVEQLVVGGDLGYRSASDAEGLELAEVGGATVKETPLPPNIRVRALGFMARFMVVLFLTTTALAVAYGWPSQTNRAVSMVGSRPARSWLTGLALLLTPVFVAAIGALIFNLAPASAAFPLLLIIAPVVLALFGVVFALLLVAGIPAVAWLAGVLFKKADLYGAILIGGLGAGLLWYLPILGVLVPLAVLPLGLGAWVLSRSQETAAVG